MAQQGDLRVEAGLELGGRYRLDVKLGQGGMGEVWRGTDVRLRRAIAVKILPPRLAADDESGVARFQREAETTAALQHPGITVTFDVGEQGDGPDRLMYLVMELLEGRDLMTFLREQPGLLPIGQVVSLITQVADALAAAHSRGIVHRDIKPANLFVLNDGRVKVCDFGIAHLTDAVTQLTATGTQIGTPRYMAPEQFQGERLDHRVDLYALGCVLYELLTGAPPFTSEVSSAAVMYQHLREAPVPPGSVRPDVPDGLNTLTLDLLAKDPARRPPSAAAVVSLLREPDGGGPYRPPMPPVPPAQPGQPVQPTRPEQPTVPAPSPSRGRKKGLIAVAAAALAVAVAAGAFVLLNNSGHGKRHVAATTSTHPTGRPGADSNPAPVVPGWQAMLAPGYGVAYDVPRGWKLEQPGTFMGFEDTKGNGLAGEKAVAHADTGKCHRAQTGLRGGSDPLKTPSDDQLMALAGTADEEARKWASAAYGGGDGHPPAVTTDSGAGNTITVNGIKAAHVTATVTPSSAEKKADPCTPPHSVVQTVAMAATANASAIGPLIFIVFADRNTPGAVTGAELDKIVTTIRPYTCPPGKSTHGENRCT